MIRIRDVADHAGVSTATVSRVMNGQQVRPDLVDAVWRSVNELGYAPDRRARSLRRRSSDVVSLILPDIENPFYTSLARGVEDVVQTAGLSLVLCNSDEDPDKEQTYLRIAQSEKMAGVIIAPATAHSPLRPVIASGSAVVAVDRALNEPVDSVTCDNERLAEVATEDLLRRGNRRIACIAGPASASTANDRLRGWEKAMSAAKMDSESLSARVEFRVDGGREATREFLSRDERPDAILALNNLVGVGALQVLTEEQQTDVALGVIGELPFATSRASNVVVTSLHPRQMGTTAATMLLERIKGLEGDPRTVVQPVTRPQLLRW